MQPWGARATSWRRRIIVGASGLIAAGALGTSEFLLTEPGTRHAAVVTTWFEDNAALLEWRALLLALAAVAVVAFAMSFRELTWSMVPEHLWAGTLMVLAALGYAALTSVAAAIDLGVLGQLPGVDGEAVALAYSTRTALLAVATPAIVVVVLGASMPLVRGSLGGQATTIVAAGVVLLLVLPPTWSLGRRALPVWFALAALVTLWPGGAITAPVGTDDRSPAPAGAPDDGQGPLPTG